MANFRVGDKVFVELGKYGDKIVYGKIVKIAKSKNKVSYKVKFDDGDVGDYYADELHKYKIGDLWDLDKG